MSADSPDPDACVIDPEDVRYVGRLCRRHYHRLQASLDEIAALCAILPWADPVTPGDGDADGRSATRVHSGAPGSLYSMALTDRRAVVIPGDDDFIPDVPGTLASWATMVAGERAPQHDGWQPTVLESVRMLSQHRLWVAQQDWVADLAADIETCHRHLARATGAGMWAEPVGNCPTCGLPVYRSQDGRIDCTRCGGAWTPADLWRAETIKTEGEQR